MGFHVGKSTKKIRNGSIKVLGILDAADRDDVKRGDILTDGENEYEYLGIVFLERNDNQDGQLCLELKPLGKIGELTGKTLESVSVFAANAK